MTDPLEAVRVAAAELRRVEALFHLVAARRNAAIVAAARSGVGRKAIARAGRVTRQRVGMIIREADQQDKDNRDEGECA